MKIYKDYEIRALAGHPDAIPPQFIEWFLKGWRACEHSWFPNEETSNSETGLWREKDFNTE